MVASQTIFIILALVLQGAGEAQAAGSVPPTQPQTRRTGFFHGVHSTFTDILMSRRRRTKSLAKRSGAVNVRNQCVLKTASDNPLTTPSGGGGISNATSSTSLGGTSSSTKTGKSSPTSTDKGGTATTTTTGATATATSPWIKKLDASGSSFFDNWSFWSTADPTDGTVQYTTSSQAAAANLTDIDSNGYAIMRVDTTPVVSGNRMSVRIQSNDAFTEGLWIMDSIHMPVGCGVWPAWWTVGPNWPNEGEIDIVEGVNFNTYNQASLHTGPGCTISQNFGGTGTLVAQTDCSANDTGNQGCGIRFPDANSYGAGFNSNGGGVYAMKWDSTGVSIYFFERNSIPSDITADAPLPANWGTPVANYPAATCSPTQFINDHTSIFDTTLCGQWAGSAWSTAPNGGGDSCATQTGVATCAQWVANNGASFSEAYWQVKSVRVYQIS